MAALPHDCGFDYEICRADRLSRTGEDHTETIIVNQLIHALRKTCSLESRRA